IGAEQTASGYEVAWKYTGLDQYLVWATDSNGDYTSSIIGTAVSGSNDTLESLETSFHQDLNGDGTIGIPTAVVEALGTTSLVQAGSNYFLKPVAGGTGPSLKLNGTEVVSGQFGAWTPIGAEQTASGYEVAWKYTGADQYLVWVTDSNGNYTSSIIGTAVLGSNGTLESLETSFHQDLNGDGTIGIPTAVVEAFGTTSLVEAGSNYFLNPVAGGTGPSLKLNGTEVVSGQFGAWTSIGAEQTASGYEVAWKYTGLDQYLVWATDSNGDYTSSIIGTAVSGSNDTLESLETSFHQDLNGDGVIGVPSTVIESMGTTSLVQVGSNYFLNPVAGGPGVELKYNGSPVVNGQLSPWVPIGAEQTANGFEFAWKTPGADSYTVWSTDSGGSYLTNLTGIVSGSSSALKSLESSFHQDLNGDGVIGVHAATTGVSNVVPPSLLPLNPDRSSSLFTYAVFPNGGFEAANHEQFELLNLDNAVHHWSDYIIS
ncbi:hypothetical protein JQ607_26935, partial [Bradyrhizobium liaoningense]|nr:hypothetical protein [Bradyrhizobium liaoningense]